MGPEAWFVAPAGSAAIAAVFAWLSGLPLRRAAGDPTLAERFHRHRVRLAIAVAASAVVPLVVLQYAEDVGTGPWLVPGAVAFLFVASFGATVGGYPLRRALSGEGNSLSGYLIRSTRTVLAMYGFWISVALLPYLVHALGWPVAVPLGGLLLFWSRHHPRFVCGILGVEPLHDPEFERIMDRSPARRPLVYSFGDDRGSLVNAFALPSVHAPRILMSRPLLRDLSPAEAAGVFAHELAHHEDFKPETLRQWGWQERAFIVVGALSPLVLSPALLPYLLWGWPLLLLVSLGRRAHGMQDRERYSDRRAVELCGDGEAFIRALEKIHVANHIPRRMAGEAEQRATHPSLARRVAALREEPDRPQPPPVPGGEYRSRKDPNAALHIEGAALRWVGGPESRTVPLANLVELRLIPRRGGARLRAVERSGEKHRFDVLPEDVERMQAALDQRDDLLAELPKRSHWEGLGQLVALLVGLAGLLAATRGAFSLMSGLLLVIPVLVVARRRSRAEFAAIGAMALYVTAQSLLLEFDRSWWGDLVWACIATTGVGGALLLWTARRTQAALGRVPRLWIVAGILAWGTMALTLLQGDPAFRLHVLGRTSPALFLPWIAAGAALLSLRRPIGVFVLALGLSGLLLGSGWFWRTATDDPFAALAPPCTIEESAYAPLYSVVLPDASNELRLSPGALRYMACSYDRVRVGAIGGEHHDFAARDAAFVDDERVLKLIGSTAGFRLELARWDAPQASVWSLPLERWALAVDAELCVDGDRWEIFAGRHRFVTARLRGRIGSDDVEYRSWVTDDGRIGERFAEVDGALLENGTVLGVRRGARGLLDGVYDASVVRRIEGDSYTTEFRTAAYLGALAPVKFNGESLFVSHGPGGGALWTYDARNRRLTARAQVGACRTWKWDGRHVAIVQEKSLGLVDLRSRSMKRVALPDGPRWDVQIALSDGRVLIGWQTAEGLRLDLIDLR